MMWQPLQFLQLHASTRWSSAAYLQVRVSQVSMAELASLHPTPAAAPRDSPLDSGWMTASRDTLMPISTGLGILDSGPSMNVIGGYLFTCHTFGKKVRAHIIEKWQTRKESSRVPGLKPSSFCSFSSLWQWLHGSGSVSVTFTALGQLWSSVDMYLDMCRISGLFLMCCKANSPQMVFCLRLRFSKYSLLHQSYWAVDIFARVNVTVCVQYTDLFVTVPFGSG